MLCSVPCLQFEWPEGEADPCRQHMQAMIHIRDRGAVVRMDNGSFVFIISWPKSFHAERQTGTRIRPDGDHKSIVACTSGVA